jgi:GT2 family glycosyltransferase
MIQFGLEDIELCVRLWTQGYECLLVPEVDVAHLNRGTGTYPDYQCDWETILHNILRLGIVHFGADCIRRMVEWQVAYAEFPAAFARLAASDAWRRRDLIHAVRRHDDDWFFDRFDMEF